MREILFRGKSKYNNEWIYGSLVRLGKESFSDPDRYGITDKGIPIGNMNVCYNFQVDEVVPETVGQYTGLTDKNGKKIFEGDIVTAEGTAIGSPFFDDMVGKIVYEECAFFIEPKNPEESIYLFADECADIEVIGNIHDNPELLKGVTEQ